MAIVGVIGFINLDDALDHAVSVDEETTEVVADDTSDPLLILISMETYYEEN
jgi:hypothetical protein